MDERERLVLQQRAIEALRERIAQESYLDVAAVCERLGISRALVEATPPEILPWVNASPGPGRVYRRYHPADVAAYDARKRGWDRARQRGEGEAYLARLRAELETLDAAAVDAALDARKAVA